MRDLCDCISDIYPVNSTVIICGDFNLPNIDWSVDNCLKCCDVTCSGLFLDFLYTHGLQQLVSSPTRLDHILDLVFCNNYNYVLNVLPAAPFSTSDHCQVHFHIPYNVESVNRVTTFFYFKLADWTNIKAYLNSVDFFELFHSNQSASAKIDEFYHIINACVEYFVPLKSTSVTARCVL
jgi:hypothetical protein